MGGDWVKFVPTTSPFRPFFFFFVVMHELFFLAVLAIYHRIFLSMRGHEVFFAVFPLFWGFPYLFCSSYCVVLGRCNYWPFYEKQACSVFLQLTPPPFGRRQPAFPFLDPATD